MTKKDKNKIIDLFLNKFTYIAYWYQHNSIRYFWLLQELKFICVIIFFFIMALRNLKLHVFKSEVDSGALLKNKVEFLIPIKAVDFQNANENKK